MLPNFDCVNLICQNHDFRTQLQFKGSEKRSYFRIILIIQNASAFQSKKVAKKKLEEPL